MAGPLFTYIGDFINYLSQTGRYSEHTLKAYASDLKYWDQRLARALKESKKEATDLDGGKKGSDPKLEYLPADLFLKLSPQKNRISRRTYARRIQALRRFHRYLKKGSDPKFANLPTWRFPKVRIPKSLPLTLSPEECQTLIDSTELQTLPTLRLFIIIAYTCGLRISEVAGLQWSHINWGSDTLLVADGKGGKQRLIPLLTQVKDILSRLRSNTTTAPWIVPHHSNPLQALDTRWTQKKLRTISLQVLGKFVHPHAMRHSFATQLLSNGCHLKHIQEFLGHSSLKTTQIYTHLAFSDIDTAYQKAHPLGDSSTPKKSFK